MIDNSRAPRYRVGGLRGRLVRFGQRRWNRRYAGFGPGHGSDEPVSVEQSGVHSCPRRFGYEAFQHGWYHWSEKSLAVTPGPARADRQPEYSFYLKNNGAGDEFRSNDKVIDKFLNERSVPDSQVLKSPHSDVSAFPFPSRERALQLNKAYRVIVAEPSFTKGRDATVIPPVNLHQKVIEDQPSGVASPLTGP